MAERTQYTIFWTNETGNTSNAVRQTVKGKNALLAKLRAENRLDISVEELHYDAEGTRTQQVAHPNPTKRVEIKLSEAQYAVLRQHAPANGVAAYVISVLLKNVPNLPDDLPLRGKYPRKPQA